MFKKSAAKYATLPAVSFKKDGQYITLSYEHLYQRVLMASRGLIKAGLQPGDRVAILSENRTGWVISDLGTQTARGITVPIYATNTPEQVADVINHCGAEIVFVSNRLQYEKLLSVREKISGVRHVFSFERFLGSREFPVNTLYQLSEISHPLTEEEQGSIEAGIELIGSNDLMTIIYTSGTTGAPKGVMLTHANMLFDAHYGVEKLGGMPSHETFLSFLPLCHVLERTAGYHAALLYGCHIAFAESVEKVVENIIEVRPTMMVSVPRLFEKIYSRIYENVHQMNPLKRKMFHKAVEIGREYIYCKYVQQKKTGLLGVKYRLADRLVFKKIRERFGGRLRLFISGGAPLDKTINEFMWIIGIPTCEGYGLTETSPAVTLNSVNELRFGSVGRPLMQTEAKLADDGELMLKGPQVMQGYYKNPEATAEVLKDGWLSTGDIARIDAEGYVYIVDRKKEIIITAGGKNIAPQPIENELKLDKYISQAFVHGDRLPYLVALVTPNLERLIELAHQERIDYFDLEDLVANAKVQKIFEERIAEVNAKLPSYETIKKFVILPREFSVEGGELTPTLKFKRKVIYQKYKEKIDSLYYAEGNGFGNQNKNENGGKG
ncbi:MAG: long-chain fatty acid--CoA ligase [Desulfuromonadales bacterium]|nr:long-chain fatty acid--CoA ligase [Desulfuromonadales bacterium]MDT8422851.1 long-chain fatty acid--CoA ligase [Desulfuromonadales bacterium]